MKIPDNITPKNRDRLILKEAIKHDSNSIILSGEKISLSPSFKEIQEIKLLSYNMKVAGIPLLDNVIFHQDQYLSYKESSMINEKEGIYNLTASSPITGNIKENIINQYREEFPAIKHISEKTAKIIDNLNTDKRIILPIEGIKDLYKVKGKILEGDYSKDDLVEFKKLDSVIEDLKKAQLEEKKIQAQEKALTKQVEKNMEMVQ